jgi:hypothetical protein
MKVSLIVVLLIVILLIANLVTSAVIVSKIGKSCQYPAKAKSLPCESMPIKFALEHPDCANKLLEAMNVTTVKVLPRNSTNTLIQKVRTQLQNNAIG